jgi:hypothetical protein
MVKNENYEASYNDFLQLIVGDNSDDSDNSTNTTTTTTITTTTNNKHNDNNTTVTSKDFNNKNLYASRVNAKGTCNVKAYTISIYLMITF